LSGSMKLEDVKGLAEKAVEAARTAGASYAEARVHGTRGRQLFLKNGEVQPATFEEGFGIGVRVLSGGALGFAATNSMDLRSVNDVTLKGVRLAKATAGMMDRPITFDGSKASKRKVQAEEKERVEGGTVEWLRGVLSEIEGRIAGGKAGVDIPGRIMALGASVSEKYYVNSDGAKVEARVPHVGFFGSLVASSGAETAQRYIQIAETGGLEVVKRAELVSRVEEEAKVLGRVLKTTDKPPADLVDVILSSELSGIAAHESVGHPQEADRILGREGAQAGESYLKRDSLGTKVGSDQAEISDDPTLPHSNGFSPVDDEGVDGRKRRLIKGGVITEFLQNRYTAAEFGLASNGASRSSSFDREPIIRMSNTFVEPGDYSFEEMVKQVRHGIYLKSFTEWNIDDKRLNQRYVGLEAFAIEGGELKGMIKAPVLEITTPKLWGSVKARSKNLRFDAATCGKGDPMQGVPVWTGGPETLLGGIKLGTR
jgi:TldD protein